MGQLICGVWKPSFVFSTNLKGEFLRDNSQFNHTIETDSGLFQPVSQRYHLYVSHACPWAHRVMIMRSLKELEAHISFSVVCPDMLEHGWTFSMQHHGCNGDDLYGFDYLYELYQKTDPEISTRVTVPVLWDKQQKTIVNNESSQILRIFNSAFNHITKNTIDYYPREYQKTIDQWNDIIYHNINNGVYRCGFASTQSAYDQAVDSLFSTLDDLDRHLQSHDYLVGTKMTEADIRLITTLVRFDMVYHTHFKCNLRRIKDYTALYAYLDRMRSIQAIQKTTNIEHIKRHYFFSHKHINPSQIIPKGPIEF